MRSERNKDEDDAVLKRAAEVYKTFLAELGKRGHTVYKEWSSGGDGRYRITELDGVSFEISFHPEFNRGSWYRIYKDKLRIQIGDDSYGRRKQFPEPKKGFDWKKIIDYIEEFIEQQRARLDVKTREKANYNSAKTEIRSQLDHYGMNIQLTAVEHSLTGPRIKISFNESFTPAETGEILSLLSCRMPGRFKK